MKKAVLIFSVILAAACSSTRQLPATQQNSVVVDGKLFTTVFQQRAAEYKALCYQAYNIAYFRLGQELTVEPARPRAIITDIDETVLDNSSYAAKRSLQGGDYTPATWAEFTGLAVSDTVPGALAFLQYAASNKVEIFYITNREQNERSGTLQNLKKFGFPNADEAHLLTKAGTSGKEARRQQVTATHDVVLLLGDNLSDFSFLFDKKTSDERSAAANALAPQFGNKFIVLPNPNYGDWETSLYKYKYDLTPAQKDSILRSSIKAY
jgi:5'-nucleotidase (lipoprotein e(P4) family)